MQVVKRNGVCEPLDIGKVRVVVERAVVGLDVESHVLEAQAQIMFHDKMETRKIQQSLISTAVRMADLESPDWSMAAGRLLQMDLHKEIELHRPAAAPYRDYRKLVTSLVDMGLYDERILKEYTPQDLDEAGTWLVPDRDSNMEYAAVYMFSYRYLIKSGHHIMEMPQEAFLTISLLLASAEPKANRLSVARAMYEALGTRKISLATPILLNLRRPNGSLTSCFISQLGDDLDSIFWGIHQFARVSKNGGAMGIDVSEVRASSSTVNGRPGVSGGVIPWIRIFNDTAVAVNQGGVRAGSVTLALRVWHADIMPFLELQTEAGDQRQKAFDVFPQVVCPDLFMRRVETQESWHLFCPFEVQERLGIDLVHCWGEVFEQRYLEVEQRRSELDIVTEINARDLFKEIMKRQQETGKPYLAFIDTINKANPNKDDGMIPCVNLCVESFSNVLPTFPAWRSASTLDVSGGLVHCCNLVSLVMTRVEESELETLMGLSVRILDNTIFLTTPPIPEAGAHNDRYRTIGVGVMGWADWLAKRSINYRADAALTEADRVFEILAYQGFKASMLLAKERGSFEAFPVSELAKGHFLGKTAQELSQEGLLGDLWVSLAKDVQKHGIRNSQIMAIAPTSSTSLVQGALPSFLPAYSVFYQDKMGAQTFPVLPAYVKDQRWFYPEMKTMDQNIIVNMTARIQKWVDTGISMELVFNRNNPEVSPKHVFEVLLNAWRQGVKTVYYVRSIQKDGRMSEKDECVSCSG